jgi:hypothetical protein
MMSSPSNERAARVEEELRKVREAAELKKQKEKEEAEEKEKREREASPEPSTEVREKLPHLALSLTWLQDIATKRAEVRDAIDKFFDLLREKAVLEANNEALLKSAAVIKEAQAANMDEADERTVAEALRRFK